MVVVVRNTTMQTVEVLVRLEKGDEKLFSEWITKIQQIFEALPQAS
jgi:hypothetical protein